jgi:protein-disulfide isomerase
MPTDVELVASKARQNSWILPGAIIFAGLILGGTLYSYRLHQQVIPAGGDITLLRSVDESDHIIGSPSAPVKIIEYSDIDSSYSKAFQPTLEQAMSEYAAGGKVAWVYRHLPLVDQHANSEEHAEAAECMASLGGPTMFMRFISALNSQAPGSLEFSPNNYDVVVQSLGILPEGFNACLSARTFQKKVANDFSNGLAIGAGGSPFTVIAVQGQKPITIDGAIPYASLKKIIDTSIAKIPQ